MQDGDRFEAKQPRAGFDSGLMLSTWQPPIQTDYSAMVDPYPSDSDRYFGWIRQTGDDGKMDFAIQADPLSPEVVEEFEEIVSFFGRIRPTLIDFLALSAEHASLLHLPAELHAIYDRKLVPIIDVGSRTVETHVIVERRLSAFLSSASAFRDRLLARLSAEPTKHSKISEHISRIYDASLDYRFCYNLRNHSQHQSNPIHIIPVRAASSNDDGALAFEIDLEIDLNVLIQSTKKIQPKVKAELAAKGGKMPLLPSCTAYFAGLRDIFLFYLLLNSSDLQTVVGYEAAVRAVFPDIPEGATPLLFHGRPNPRQVEGHPSHPFKLDCKVTSFSFDELQILREIISTRP